MIDVALTPVGAPGADDGRDRRAARDFDDRAALHAGYARVRCVPDLDAARALAAPGRVLAGERRCPAARLRARKLAEETTPPQGDELVLTTTNGVPALSLAAKLSPRVLVACLLNLDAVVEQLDGDTQILCSGTDGRLGLDDVYVAGRIAAACRPRHRLRPRRPGRRATAGRSAWRWRLGGRALIAAGLE